MDYAIDVSCMVQTKLWLIMTTIICMSEHMTTVTEFGIFFASPKREEMCLAMTNWEDFQRCQSDAFSKTKH